MQGGEGYPPHPHGNAAVGSQPAQFMNPSPYGGWGSGTSGGDGNFYTPTYGSGGVPQTNVPVHQRNNLGGPELRKTAADWNAWAPPQVRLTFFFFF